MNDVSEGQKQALLRHLGDVFEAIGCLAKVAGTYSTVRQAVEAEDSLAGLSILSLVDSGMTPMQFIERASAAYLLWPTALLSGDVNTGLLAYTVLHDLFPDNPDGWETYLIARRKEAPWFGYGMPSKPSVKPEYPR